MITWHQRAAGGYLFLHPSIYGLGDFDSRTEKVAKALGVATTTVQHWFGLNQKISEPFMEKWVPITRDMKWKDVRVQG